MIRRSFLVLSLLSCGVLSFAEGFESIISRIDTSYDVRTAIIELEQSRGTVDELSHPGDIVFSLDPSVKVVTQEGESIGGEVQVTGSASARIPVSLSAAAKERLAFSTADVKAREVALDAARIKTYISIFSLYQNIWLLQQEEILLGSELKAAELAYRSASERYALGSVTLKVLDDAGSTLEDKKEELLQNTLNQRISWFQLVSIAGVEEEPVSLAAISLKTGELPKPAELYDWVNSRHPLLIAEREKMRQMEVTASRLEKADFDLGFKAFYNSAGNTVTASVGYDFVTPVLTPSIGFPVYTFGEIPSSSGGISTWNLGMTLNLSLGTGKSDRLTVNDLMLEMEKSRLKIDYLTESVNLVLRTAYQQHLKNISALDEARRNLSVSNESRKIVTVRRELNQASDLDVLVADSAVKRSQWKIDAARINVEKSWLTLLNSALKLNPEELVIIGGENG